MKLFRNLISKKGHNKVLILLKTDLKMEYIFEAIYNHLNMKTSGALLITGDWGSGKTYHVKNQIIPRIVIETDFIPLIVSLYGLSDKNDIAQRVLFAYLDKKGKNSNISTGTVARNLKNLSEAIPLISKYVNLEKLITGTGDNIFKFLPHDKLFICFDDLERISEKVDVDDFMGIVNELVENKGSKVLIIANEKEIKNGISFKEKTIEKTIHFSPNISSVLDSIIDSYTDNNFKEYLKTNKDYILKTLDSKTDNDENTKELNKLFSNIRTIKFAIEHFKYPFLILSQEKDINNELINNQLKSIWLFTLAISSEFRKPNNITFTERKNLDKQTSSLLDIDLSNFNLNRIDQKEDTIEKENEWTFSVRFKELYYNRLSEQYIYHSEIYDLITSGRKITNTVFLSDLEKSFNIKDGKIHPAHELLKKFMLGYWTFSNEEFKKNLQSLLDYAERGELLDIVSYLNAGVYLFGFAELFDTNKERIYEKLKAGLDSFLSKITINYLLKTQFEMVSGDFKDEYLLKLISFIKEKMVILEKENNKKEAERLSKLINNDLEAFVKEFIPGDGSIRTPDKAIFHQLDQEIVNNSVSTWTGKGIMDFWTFLKYRYLDTGFIESLKNELVFLETIESGIKLINFSEKTLSNHLLETHLVPRIKECKQRLNQH